MIWADARDMASDGMTKGSVEREALIAVCQLGVWKIVGLQPIFKQLRS